MFVYAYAFFGLLKCSQSQWFGAKLNGLVWRVGNIFLQSHDPGTIGHWKLIVSEYKYNNIVQYRD